MPLNAQLDAETARHDLIQEYKAALESAIGPAANGVWKELMADQRVPKEETAKLYPIYAASLKAGAVKVTK